MGMRKEIAFSALDIVVDSSYIVLFYGSSYDEQGCFHTSTILIIAQK